MAKILDQKSSFYVLAVVVMGAFLIPYMGAALNVSLPSIGREFSLDLVILGWIPTVIYISQCRINTTFWAFRRYLWEKKDFHHRCWFIYICLIYGLFLPISKLFDSI